MRENLCGKKGAGPKMIYRKHWLYIDIIYIIYKRFRTEIEPVIMQASKPTESNHVWQTFCAYTSTYNMFIRHTRDLCIMQSS